MEPLLNKLIVAVIVLGGLQVICAIMLTELHRKVKAMGKKKKKLPAELQKEKEEERQWQELNRKMDGNLDATAKLETRQCHVEEAVKQAGSDLKLHRTIKARNKKTGRLTTLAVGASVKDEPAEGYEIIS